MLHMPVMYLMSAFVRRLCCYSAKHQVKGYAVICIGPDEAVLMFFKLSVRKRRLTPALQICIEQSFILCLHRSCGRGERSKISGFGERPETAA